MAEQSFDAIVVGSGISGGWAAKELCEKGLKTLVLERGRKLNHIVDYETAETPPWELAHRGQRTQTDIKNQPIQSQTFAYNEGNKHLWINDNDNPYTTPDDKPFMWFRGDHVGGRSLTWGRQVYRMSDMDFKANAADGHGVDWPVRYTDIEPWYNYVERFIGVSGEKDNIPQLPDSICLPPFQLNCLEQHTQQVIAHNWNNRQVITGRVANLTRNHNGRNKCMGRNTCNRGCPYGAYFSSQSSTLPAATATGNLTLKPHSIVEKVLYDGKNKLATGVQVRNSKDNTVTIYKAKVIFLCASTISTAHILLNSANQYFPNGLANTSNQVGRNLMEHCGVMLFGMVDGFEDKYYFGDKPNGFYIPRFRNISDTHPAFVRGYGFQGTAFRRGWSRGFTNRQFGARFKEDMCKPGPWVILLAGYCETLPNGENRVSLNRNKFDKYGIPTVHINFKYRDNEHKMVEDMITTGKEMLHKAGVKNVIEYRAGMTPGMLVHEMGTARMGHNPQTSVVNQWNQCHDIRNLFITDGSFMTSSACQNPSLTYMAFTARAVDYCVEEMRKGSI